LSAGRGPAYGEVVAGKTAGLTEGADWQSIQPFLSRELIRRIATARACQDDLDRRQAKASKDKPPLAWIDSGLFSGESEESAPDEAVVGRVERSGNASYRVYVRLTWRHQNDSSRWSVCAIVTSEDGRYVIDDVLFFKDDERMIPTVVHRSLSPLLSLGCDGPRWTGQGLR